MPRAAVSHIQNTAPGPPAATAVATPAMLPKPTVPPMAVAMVSNGCSIPLPDSFLSAVPWKIWPTVFFMIQPKWVNWKNPDRTVK